MNKNTIKKISVNAPARLHMGFIDLSGALGRYFGSIGIALNEHAIRLHITSAQKLTICDSAPSRTYKTVQRFCERLNVSDRLEFKFNSLIPEHIGLGSGTQLALAVGMGLNAFYDLNLTVRDIAALSDRGARSGIGIGVFEQGGFVVDGGRGTDTLTPPLISRLPIPSEWRFILVFDKRGQGLHGQQEIAAFKALPPFPEQEAARLCYLLLMQGLPAIAEQDIIKFGDVITQLQSSVGEHFASAQGGVFTSAEVAAAMDWLQQQGATAIGQTSWGPTGFCAVPDFAIATELVTQARQKFDHLINLSFEIVSARNSGAETICSYIT